MDVKHHVYLLLCPPVNLQKSLSANTVAITMSTLSTYQARHATDKKIKKGRTRPGEDQQKKKEISSVSKRTSFISAGVSIAIDSKE